MKKLFVRKEQFCGVFPHKGKLCVKLDRPWPGAGIEWVPIDGRALVLARVQQTSEGYLPLEVCGPHPAEAEWTGLTGRRLVDISLCPDGVVVLKDYWLAIPDGPDIYKECILVGSLVFHCQGGNPSLAGKWWVVD